MTRSMEQYLEVPIYRKIALDFAGKIYYGDYREGDRVSGRSTLAGSYNVSPETIRRAMNLLEDMKVVSTNQGSGIFILSKKNAYDFIQRFNETESIQALKAKIKDLERQRESLNHQINTSIDNVIDYCERLKNINPINPVEYTLDEECFLIGKNMNDVSFWQNTGGTIVGIRRQGKIIISPGPYIGFEKGDTLFVVGDIGVLERIREFAKREV